MSMNDDEIGDIKLKPGAAMELALKILLLLLVFIFPFIVVYLLQDYIITLWGEPTPTNPLYLMLVGVLLLWFAVGCAFVIPRVGRRIDKRYGPNREISG
ncbi:MAG: hypothetical protein ACXAEB_08180 [Candidatus Thorarchaeota archaeon]